MKETKLHHFQTVAIEAYVRAGWKQDRLLPHVLTKDYATAVGLKQATIRVDMLDVSSAAFLWLNGTYWSEGRNVLEPHTRLIPACLDHRLLHHKVAEYLIWLEHAIQESYAVKILEAA